MKMTTTPTRFAWAVLALLVLSALLAGWLAPHPYGLQSRELIGSAPSAQFPLGTDALGRDRLSRLLYGSRISLLVGPLAALLTTCLAGLFGGLAGYWGGWYERVFLLAADLVLSLPWLFLLLTVRAVLPLEVPPEVSLLIVFLLLGLLGWAGPARIIRASVRTFMRSEFILQARASGLSASQILFRHLLPNVMPVLSAQFLLYVPLFILSEANLGLLGLGITEPLPSWGSLLKELENYQAVAAHPWLMAPVLLLVLVVSCLQILARRQEADSH